MSTRVSTVTLPLNKRQSFCKALNESLFEKDLALHVRQSILTISLAWLGITGVIADAKAAINDKQVKIDAMILRTQTLESEMIDLRQQVHHLQQQKRKRVAVTGQSSKLYQGRSVGNPPAQKKVSTAGCLPGFVIVANGNANPVLANVPGEARGKLTDISTPLKLLQERQKAAKTFQPRPAVEIGGNLIGAASIRRSALNKKGSDINLTGASLSIAVEANPWAVGLMKLNYDAGERLEGANLPYRIANSRLFLNTATLTLGNLEQAPVYVSMGQMVVPFGNYSGILPSLTSRLGKTLQRAIVLGFQSTTTGIHAALYGFRGDSRIYPENKINNGGINIAYLFNSANLKVETGVSVIANIADSAGMQNTKAPFALFDSWAEVDEFEDEDFEELEEEFGPLEASFAGFGKTAISEMLAYRVPGVDCYTKVTVRNFSIIGEYTGATRPFDIDNLQFNAFGARPQAYGVEAAYRFNIANHATTIAAGYSHSYQALPLNMPEQTLSIGLKVSMNRYLTAGLTYRHDKNYALGNQAYGQGLPVLADNTLGRSSSSLTAQLGFKF